jgi:hypothetical protein
MDRDTKRQITTLCRPALCCDLTAGCNSDICALRLIEIYILSVDLVELVLKGEMNNVVVIQVATDNLSLKYTHIILYVW